MKIAAWYPGSAALGADIHIARINFAEFYAAAFPCLADSETFYRSVKSLNGPVPAKIALHQGARMLWLADRMDEVAHGREALQILFFLITAEAVAKIVFAYPGEGKSRFHVRRFFGEICRTAHRNSLSKALERKSNERPSGFLTWEEVVNVLYAVRCDVVHESQYFLFHLAMDSGVPTLVHLGARDFIAYMTIAQLRQIMLEGVVEGAKKLT